MNRLKIKPGITGLAQVTVGYDETIEDVKEKIAKALDNQNNYSLSNNSLAVFVSVKLKR